jgi:hypothetical protein
MKTKCIEIISDIFDGRALYSAKQFSLSVQSVLSDIAKMFSNPDVTLDIVHCLDCILCIQCFWNWQWLKLNPEPLEHQVSMLITSPPGLLCCNELSIVINL